MLLQKVYVCDLILTVFLKEIFIVYKVDKGFQEGDGASMVYLLLVSIFALLALTAHLSYMGELIPAVKLLVVASVIFLAVPVIMHFHPSIILREKGSGLFLEVSTVISLIAGVVLMCVLRGQDGEIPMRQFLYSKMSIFMIAHLLALVVVAGSLYSRRRKKSLE